MGWRALTPPRRSRHADASRQQSPPPLGGPLAHEAARLRGSRRLAPAPGGKPTSVWSAIGTLQIPAWVRKTRKKCKDGSLRRSRYGTAFTRNHQHKRNNLSWQVPGSKERVQATPTLSTSRVNAIFASSSESSIIESPRAPTLLRKRRPAERTMSVHEVASANGGRTRPTLKTSTGKPGSSRAPAWPSPCAFLARLPSRSWRPSNGRLGRAGVSLLHPFTTKSACAPAALKPPERRAGRNTPPRMRPTCRLTPAS